MLLALHIATNKKHLCIKYIGAYLFVNVAMIARCIEVHLTSMRIMRIFSRGGESTSSSVDLTPEFGNFNHLSPSIFFYIQAHLLL